MTSIISSISFGPPGLRDGDAAPVDEELPPDVLPTLSMIIKK